MVTSPPNEQYQRAVPYGSEMVTGAGVRYLVSDERSMTPCGVGVTHNSLVQPESPRTQLELDDIDGSRVTIG
eukprot:6404018-Karenia_brevis.AAC.1